MEEKYFQGKQWKLEKQEVKKWSWSYIRNDIHEHTFNGFRKKHSARTWTLEEANILWILKCFTPENFNNFMNFVQRVWKQKEWRFNPFSVLHLKQQRPRLIKRDSIRPLTFRCIPSVPTS